MTIPIDKAFDALEKLKEMYDSEYLLDSLAEAMGAWALSDNLEYFCRMHDIDFDDSDND